MLHGVDQGEVGRKDSVSDMDGEKLFHAAAVSAAPAAAWLSACDELCRSAIPDVFFFFFVFLFCFYFSQSFF